MKRLEMMQHVMKPAWHGMRDAGEHEAINANHVEEQQEKWVEYIRSASYLLHKVMAGVKRSKSMNPGQDCI